MPGWRTSHSARRPRPRPSPRPSRSAACHWTAELRRSTRSPRRVPTARAHPCEIRHTYGGACVLQGAFSYVRAPPCEMRHACTARISQGGRGACNPFNTGCLPLSYSGNPGVNHCSLQGGLPFNTGCLPLSYSGNPGVTVAYREGGEGDAHHVALGRRLPRLRQHTPLPVRHAVDPWIATVTQG